MNGWMNFTDPLDDTKTFNQTGLVSISRLLLSLADTQLMVIFFSKQ